MRAAIIRAFTEDLPIKVVALIIAVGLFVMVRSDKDAATGITLRVVYTLPSDRVLVSEPVSEVRVGVRGPWTAIQQLDGHEIDPIRVDLSRTKDTVMHFSESMIALPPGLRVVSISPPDTKLDFEPRAERDVQVQPLIDGQPQEGFRITAITVEPDRVRIAGPKRIIQRIDRITTRPLHIADATGEVRDTVQLEPPPHACQYLGAGTVTVTADVRPAIVERSIDSVPLHIAGLTHLEGNVDPPSATVILRGPSDLVRRVSPSAVQLNVDARLEDARPPALYKKRVDVAGLPAGVAAEVKPDSVVLFTRRKGQAP